ncbi:hypothetical protein TWF192_003155 [Orbilia oligospora]|nr:hypothetical protein TWF192_003155 [Orbilia oligospora]
MGAMVNHACILSCLIAFVIPSTISPIDEYSSGIDKTAKDRYSSNMEPPGLESYPGPRAQLSHFPSSPLRVRHVDSCMKLACIWVILSILSTRATLDIGGEVSKLEPISTSTRPAQRVSGGSWISQSWKESVRVLKSRG